LVFLSVASFCSRYDKFEKLMKASSYKLPRKKAVISN